MRMRSFLFAAFAAGALTGLPSLEAQSPVPGSITGTVKDSLGATITGADITASSTSARAETDDRGKFTLKNIPAGPVEVYVHRIGFRPDTVELTVYAGQSTPVEVVLHPVIPQLQTVVVHGRQDATGRIAEFYARKDRGIGRFITRSEIERRNPSNLNDMFRMVPGARLVNFGPGRTYLRFRGMQCPPMIWLDGTPLLAGEFDLDALSPYSIEGIEIYSGLSTVPAQFMGNRYISSSCGTIVIWSREGERRPKKNKGNSTPHQVATLVDQKRVFTADQVDTPAYLDSTQKIVPLYPDSLYEAGAPGTAVVEFVVDTAGKVNLETFNVVSTTHQAFAESVRRELTGVLFVPARKDGRPVPQVVHQRFEFAPDSAQIKKRKP
jgi:hypothetical protein